MLFSIEMALRLQACLTLQCVCRDRRQMWYHMGQSPACCWGTFNLVNELQKLPCALFIQNLLKLSWSQETEQNAFFSFDLV